MLAKHSCTAQACQTAAEKGHEKENKSKHMNTKHTTKMKSKGRTHEAVEEEEKGPDADLVDKLLLKGAVLTDVADDLPDLGALLLTVKGLAGANSLPHMLRHALHKQRTHTQTRK